MLFIGPTLLSGIGQHCKKYMDLFPRSKYIQIQEEIPESEKAFIFALPIPYWLDKIPEIKRKIKDVITVNSLHYLIKLQYRANFVVVYFHVSFPILSFILYMFIYQIKDHIHFII